MTVVFAPKNRKPKEGPGRGTRMPSDGGSQGRDAKPSSGTPMEGQRPMGGEEQGGGEQDMSHMGIEQVVKEHGPAHHVEIEHDHQSNHHTKTSHHKGAKHMSEHGSAEEAHEHAKMASGLGMGSGADEQSPDQQGSMDNSVPGY
jgi:hypothetical protein